MILLHCAPARAGACLLLALVVPSGVGVAGGGQVVRSGTVEKLHSPDGLATVELLLEPPAAGGVYLGRAVFLPGARAPEHRHSGSEELVYVLSGSATMTLGSDTLVVEKGMAVRIPAGVAHSFLVGGPEPMEIVQVYSPGGPEQRFRAWERAAEEQQP